MTHCKITSDKFKQVNSMSLHYLYY